MIIIKRAGTWNVVDSLFVGLNVVFTNSVHPHKLGVGALISTRFTYTHEACYFITAHARKERDGSTIKVGIESILII